MAVMFNPVAQAKFVHTVSAGYVTGSVFVLAVSAYYLLAWTPYRVRQALDDGGREFWTCIRAFCGRSVIGPHGVVRLEC